MQGDRSFTARGYRRQRWLYEGSAEGLPDDEALRQVVPPLTWVTWEQARDHLAGCLLAETGLLDTGLSDVVLWQPVWERRRADMLLADAVDRGVLSFAETAVPRGSAGLPALLSFLGAIIGRGVHLAAARLGLRSSHALVPDPHLAREIRDLFVALEAGTEVSHPSPRRMSCHRRNWLKERLRAAHAAQWPGEHMPGAARAKRTPR